MSTTRYLGNRPGLGTKQDAGFRIVSPSTGLTFKPGPAGTINGAKSRDPGNAPETYVLRAGVLLAKNASTGRYAPWEMASLTGAAASSAVSFTVGLAGAAEIVRRVGPSGTLRGIGPPTAGGTVANISITYSAVNLTTGVVTCSALSAALVAGSVIAEPNWDTPVTVVPDGPGINLTTLGVDTDFRVAVGGLVTGSQLLPWPADTALRQWIRAAMNVDGGGVFVFEEMV
jgi:hypothetical protein